jgi:transcriptional regulator with XRE-family HTH domain
LKFIRNWLLWARAATMPTIVGKRVWRRRNELGLKQEDLAQKAGISKSFLSDLENGERSIGAETLLDLGRAMGLSVDYLMTGNGRRDHEEEE